MRIPTNRWIILVRISPSRVVHACEKRWIKLVRNDSLIILLGGIKH